MTHLPDSFDNALVRACTSTDGTEYVVRMIARGFYIRPKGARKAGSEVFVSWAGSYTRGILAQAGVSAPTSKPGRKVSRGLLTT